MNEKINKCTPKNETDAEQKKKTGMKKKSIELCILP